MSRRGSPSSVTSMKSWTSNLGLLDGEVVAFGDERCPSFERLKRRMGLQRKREIEQARRDVAVSLLFFDVLARQRQGLSPIALHGRREFLESIVSQSGSDPSRFLQSWKGRG